LSLVPAVDAAWGQSTQNTVHLLEDFLDRFPGYKPATDKLYAALLAYSADLQQAGDPGAASQVLLQAQALVPDRGEADAALLALSRPEPDPAVTADTSPTSDPQTEVAAAAVQPQPTPGPPAALNAVRSGASAVGRTAAAPPPAARAAPAAPAVRAVPPAPAAPPPTPTKSPFVAPSR
jgi:hypothetical protein